MLRGSGPLEQVLGSEDGALTRVRARDAERLGDLLRAQDVPVEPDGPGGLLVRAAGEIVGVAAAEHRIVLSELTPVARSLEEAFFALTGEEAE